MSNAREAVEMWLDAYEKGMATPFEVKCQTVSYMTPETADEIWEVIPDWVREYVKYMVTDIPDRFVPDTLDEWPYDPDELPEYNKKQAVEFEKSKKHLTALRNWMIARGILKEPLPA